MSWIKMSDVGETGHPMKGVEYALSLYDDSSAFLFYWTGESFLTESASGVSYFPEDVFAFFPIPDIDEPEECAQQLQSLVYELEEWDVPQSDDSGGFDETTELGASVALLKKIGMYHA